jgi:hypothetical protein
VLTASSSSVFVTVGVVFVLQESEKAQIEALNDAEKMERKVTLLRPVFQPI